MGREVEGEMRATKGGEGLSLIHRKVSFVISHPNGAGCRWMMPIFFCHGSPRLHRAKAMDGRLVCEVKSKII